MIKLGNICKLIRICKYQTNFNFPLNLMQLKINVCSKTFKTFLAQVNLLITVKILKHENIFFTVHKRRNRNEVL